jgi:hypothetical protein
MKKVLFVCMGMFVLVSCADLQREQYVKQVEQLQEKLQGLEKTLPDSRLNDISTIKVNTIQALSLIHI